MPPAPWLRLSLFCLTACAARPATAPVEPTRGSVLITHARFLDHPKATALLLAQGKVVKVGTVEELTALMPASTTVDAQGGLVLPGFHDSHAHLMAAGLGRLAVDLTEFQDLGAALAAVRKFALAHPDLPFIEGRGWQYAVAPNGLPTAAQLDGVEANRPVFLRSYDGHTGWANHAALAAAHVDATTPDPPGGRVAREPGSMTPQGALLEGAQALMAAAIPKPSQAAMLDALEWATTQLVQLGMTSVEEIAFDPAEVTLLDELAAHQKLPLRVNVSLPLDGDLGAYQKIRTAHPGPYVGFSFLKGFVDGVIESKTAFMLHPYENSGVDKGSTVVAPDKLKQLVKAAHAAGFPVALHAIGDGAVRLSLDAYEEAQRASPQVHLRHRVEHIEVVDPADVPRFKALGVVASMQPFHANPFGPTPDDGVWSKNLGPARLTHTFAWRELWDAGAVLAYGTDWPVMSANPLWGLAVATTRRDAQGDPPAGWNAHQTLTFAQALRAYTWGSAFASGREAQQGTLEPGQEGDVVVLSPDIQEDQPATLWKGSVRWTVVAGQVRYRAK